jgi:hypothetical protein
MEKWGKEVMKGHKDAAKHQEVNYLALSLSVSVSVSVSFSIIFIGLFHVDHYVCDRDQHHSQHETKYKVAKDMYEERNPKLTEQLHSLWRNRCRDFEATFALVLELSHISYRFSSLSLFPTLCLVGAAFSLITDVHVMLRSQPHR